MKLGTPDLKVNLSPEREVQLCEGVDKLAKDPSFVANRIKIVRDLFDEIRRLRYRQTIHVQRIENMRAALLQADQDFATQSLQAQHNILKALEEDARLDELENPGD